MERVMGIEYIAGALVFAANQIVASDVECRVEGTLSTIIRPAQAKNEDASASPLELDD
jgi:hypothetical protein